MARDTGPKRQIGAATYWVASKYELDEAHLIAKIGRYDSLTGMVREVMDAHIATMRVQHSEALQTMLAAMGHGEQEAT
jgi:hypothetical protein